jgi:hypothetical protein
VLAWRAYQAGPSSQATAKQWLQGQGSTQQIRAALASVLANLWTQAFTAGVMAALKLLGITVALQQMLDALARIRGDWLDEITDTRIDRIAEILARGGTAEEMADAITAVLGDEDAAHLIAITETNRAENAGRYETYRAARTSRVIWVTHSGNPCHLCIANEASGPHHLGDPFPSGDIMPPAHPQCQCTLEPAE